MSVYAEAPDDDATPELTRGGSSSSRCGDSSTSAATADLLLEDMQSTSSSVYSCASSRSVQVAVRVRPLLGDKENVSCLESLFDQKNLTLHSKNQQAFRKHPSILRVIGTSATETNHKAQPKRNNSKTNNTSTSPTTTTTNTKTPKVHLSTETGGQTFCYDEVFPETATQADLFQYRVDPLIQRCLDGYNASVLAYGQTSSGVSSVVVSCLIENGT